MPESFNGFRLQNPTSKTTPFLYSSNGLRLTGVIHARRCNLIVLTGVNGSQTEDRIVQLHDAMPRPGAVPLWVVAVPRRGQFTWVPAQSGRVFQRLHFAVSSTLAVYTPISGEGFWIDAEGVSLE